MSVLHLAGFVKLGNVLLVRSLGTMFWNGDLIPNATLFPRREARDRGKDTWSEWQGGEGGNVDIIASTAAFTIWLLYMRENKIQHMDTLVLTHSKNQRWTLSVPTYDYSFQTTHRSINHTLLSYSFLSRKACLNSLWLILSGCWYLCACMMDVGRLQSKRLLQCFLKGKHLSDNVNIQYL